MPVEKIPIESRKRTGILAGAVSRIIATTVAVIAHLVDVVAACAVGLGADNPAVAVLAHPERIGQ